LQDRPSKKAHENFTFRLKMGEQEVEIGGSQEDVMNTIKELPRIITDIDKAFEKVRPKKVTTLTVRTEPSGPQKTPTQEYPKIPRSQTSDEAVLNLLATDWGKWRPRTVDELSEALRTNGLETPLRTLSSVLMNLVKKEKIVRWHTNSGYVYILAEKEALQQKGEGLTE
jgi:hypothetical protein